MKNTVEKLSNYYASREPDRKKVLQATDNMLIWFKVQRRAELWENIPRL